MQRRREREDLSNPNIYRGVLYTGANTVYQPSHKKYLSQSAAYIMLSGTTTNASNASFKQRFISVFPAALSSSSLPLKVTITM
jgi:hypothetical protein